MEQHSTHKRKNTTRACCVQLRPDTHAHKDTYARTRINWAIFESRPPTPWRADGSGTSIVETAPLPFNNTLGLCLVYVPRESSGTVSPVPT